MVTSEYLLSPQEAQTLLAAGRATLLDIREVDEYRAAHIPGAKLMPLSTTTIQVAQGGRSPFAVADPEMAAIFHCASGRRTEAHFEFLRGLGFTRPRILAGGLEAWAKAGLPVEKKAAPMPLPRQVLLGAGSLVVLFTVLGFTVWSPLGGLAGLVGLGLMFAGLTGFCGLALLLAKMPWNREKST